MPKIPANIRNFVDQEVAVPKSGPLLPVFEAVHNALDAIAERGVDGDITISVERHPNETDGSRGAPFRFKVSDNGIGFNPANTESFNELFSIWKKPRGGKGRGRFTYLKVFDKITIDSIFEGDNETRYHKSFNFGYDFQPAPEAGEATDCPVGTTVTLSNMVSDYARNVKGNPDDLARDFISHFLPMLLTKPSLKIVLKDPTPIDISALLRDELFIDDETESFAVRARSFTLKHVRLRPNQGIQHRLVLAAAGREVGGIALDREVPVLSKEPLGSDPAFIAMEIVAGDYLDQIADPGRLGFRGDNDAEMSAPSDLLGDPTLGMVREKAIELVSNHLAEHLEQAISERTAAIQGFIRRDGLGYHFLRGKVRDIAMSLKAKDDRSIEGALHNEAFKERQERNAAVRALLNATPKEKSEKGYYERWQKTVDRIGDVAKSELADYVAHRKAILDLVTDLLRAGPDGRHRREDVIHNIIFPQYKQSGEVSEEQQNLWLIDERLSFHEHLYSDVSIKRITGGREDSTQRPDLAIFESGFASFHDAAQPTAQIILIELKKPARDNVSRDDPVGKAIDYVRKIKRGKARTEGNAVIQIDENALTTVYLLADWTGDFREYLDRENFDPFPGEDAQYLYRPKDKIMFIAISFDRLIETARRRNKIFFKKLGLE
jgi:hypothetical protein